MAQSTSRKRSREGGAKPNPKQARPTKKQRQIAAYHSDSDSIDGGIDEEDISGANQIELGERRPREEKLNDVADELLAAEVEDPKSAQIPVTRPQGTAKDAPAEDESSEDGIGEGPPESDLDADEFSDAAIGENDEDSDEDEDGTTDSDADSSTSQTRKPRSKSKRNDPDAFASSLSKILSTKLTTTRRADPVLARSSAASEASRRAIDAALETKARKKLRDQKRLAMEKGRVRDVLVASSAALATVDSVTGKNAGIDGDGETTAQLMETEKRLRKVAQRGVVKLFNAVRAAQVQAAEAERGTRKQGAGGRDQKDAKVTEMSRKGFLDLIASGGGTLKKGGLEEA